MSVVFTTYSDQFIMLCADMQSTNMKAGEVHDSAVTKVERWAPYMAIGWAGNAALASAIVDAVHHVAEENGISGYTVEEMSDMFCQCFYAAKDEYTNMPAGLSVQFMVAGKLSNGNLGVGSIYANDDGPDLEIYEGTNLPSTTIFAPEDMTNDECNLLFQKAIANTRNKHTHQRNPLEMIHRKAVRYVSERSKYVSHKSDFVLITLQER